MRIGINLPDNLLKRIEPLKPTINVSRICRDAIEAYATGYERAQEHVDADGTRSVADGFWAEEKGEVIDWDELGYHDARDWVRAATLKDIKYLFHNIEVSQRLHMNESILFYRFIPGTKVFWDRQAEHRDWFIRQIEWDERTNYHERAREEYERAWLAYVTVIWERVQQLQQDGAQTRLDARAARPEPDVPAHLVAGTEPSG